MSRVRLHLTYCANLRVDGDGGRPQQITPQQITTMCPVCKNESIVITDVESGEIICNKCGIVISERIEESNQQQHIFSVGEMSRDKDWSS